MIRLLRIALAIGAVAAIRPSVAQTPPPPAAPPASATPAARPPRPPAPTRDPNTPGYVTAKELPDGDNAAGGCRRQFHHWPHAQPPPRK